MVAALALGVVSIYLIMKGKNALYAIIPMLFVITMTIWATFNNIMKFYADRNIALIIISVIILILTFWLLISGILFLAKRKRSEEFINGG